jgi:hypothetical protein
VIVVAISIALAVLPIAMAEKRLAGLSENR